MDQLAARLLVSSVNVAARTRRTGKTLKGRVVWREFKERGWVWQDTNVPDYMHFDTGDPSRPYERPYDVVSSASRKLRNAVTTKEVGRWHSLGSSRQQ